MASLRKWSITDSEELYNIASWGQGYFSINERGHLEARPNRRTDRAIDIPELLEDARQQGLHLPLLVRFSDILQNRLEHLIRCFERAIEQEAYPGRYVCAFPVKVNQQRQVVAEIIKFGEAHKVGLEVGSKPELHAMLAMQEGPGALLVCNGYKDKAYIRLALLAQNLGKQVFLVVEKPAELETILAVAAQEGLRPKIGIRIKLVASGSGRWEDSGGDHSKFGLTSTELVDAVDRLKAAGMLDTFCLIHVHLGSQITNIRRIKESLREVTRYWVELCKMGCAIDNVDLGGGLGVDYDGSRTTDGFSINYTEQEYANDIIGAFAAACRLESLPAPVIITESGRALTAHHAMLAVNVMDSASLESPHWDRPLPADAPEVMQRLEALRAGLNARNLHEFWHDALHLRDEVNTLFEVGLLNLRERARAEQSFWMIARRAERLMNKERRPGEDWERLELILADKVFCNFSVFQSLPDSWAMGQEFPVMPLHRLKEKPTQQAVLQDVTCDSDGRLASYIGQRGPRATLPLHPFKPGEPYWLGIFLTGAYQEILGDLHNLFGDTNTVHVAQNEAGDWRYEEIIQAESISDVLDSVQYDQGTLIDRIERQVRASIDAGRMCAEEGQQFRKLFASGLNHQTYLEPPAVSAPAAKIRATRSRARVLP